MINYIFKYNGYTFKRIPKNKARSAYNHNLTVILCPCNLRPFNFWSIGSARINKKTSDQDNFDNIVNYFEYYNCNTDSGKYTAFYIPVVECGKFTRYDYDFIND